jgi:hypothetical protein
MISPLGQRQILQTAAVETVRAAMEGGLQVQREQARRQAFDAKLAEAQLDVPEVMESDVLKLREHGPHDQGNRQKHGTGSSDAFPGEPEGSPADGAEPHLDLLA